MLSLSKLAQQNTSPSSNSAAVIRRQPPQVHSYQATCRRVPRQGFRAPKPFFYSTFSDQGSESTSAAAQLNIIIVLSHHRHAGEKRPEQAGRGHQQDRPCGSTHRLLVQRWASSTADTERTSSSSLNRTASHSERPACRSAGTVILATTLFVISCFLQAAGHCLKRAAQQSFNAEW